MSKVTFCKTATHVNLDPESVKGRVQRTAEKIKQFCLESPKKSKVHAIACCGLSGLLVAAPVSVELGLPLIVVRKEKETTHSEFKVEYGILPTKSNVPVNYVIIDDFIDIGATINRIETEIRYNHTQGDFKLRAVFLYNIKEDQRQSRLAMVNGKSTHTTMWGDEVKMCGTDVFESGGDFVLNIGKEVVSYKDMARIKKDNSNTLLRQSSGGTWQCPLKEAKDADLEAAKKMAVFAKEISKGFG